MATDPFSGFKSLSKFYPGSRKKLGTMGRSEQSRGLQDTWDEKPYVKTLHGEQVEMYFVGALARAVNKSVYSIRAYEDLGHLPNTPYRLPTRMVNGTPRPGRRLYTRPMIEAVITAFAERGLLEARRIEWREHKDLPLEIARKWDELTQPTNTTN